MSGLSYGPWTLTALPSQGNTDECYNSTLTQEESVNIRVVAVNDPPVISGGINQVFHSHVDLRLLLSLSHSIAPVLTLFPTLSLAHSLTVVLSCASIH